MVAMVPASIPHVVSSSLLQRSSRAPYRYIHNLTTLHNTNSSIFWNEPPYACSIAPSLVCRLYTPIIRHPFLSAITFSASTFSVLFSFIISLYSSHPVLFIHLRLFYISITTIKLKFYHYLMLLSIFNIVIIVY